MTEKHVLMGQIGLWESEGGFGPIEVTIGGVCLDTWIRDLLGQHPEHEDTRGGSLKGRSGGYEGPIVMLTIDIEDPPNGS